MKRIKVESSMIAAVAYDENKQLLEIEFTSGRIYHYFNVKLEVYEGLMAANSKGWYFREEIRDWFFYIKKSKSYY